MSWSRVLIVVLAALLTLQFYLNYRQSVASQHLYEQQKAEMRMRADALALVVQVLCPAKDQIIDALTRKRIAVVEQTDAFRREFPNENDVLAVHPDRYSESEPLQTFYAERTYFEFDDAGCLQADLDYYERPKDGQKYVSARLHWVPGVQHRWDAWFFPSDDPAVYRWYLGREDEYEN